MAFNVSQKILIVDDMNTMRRIIKGMMTKIGCNNIAEADDGIPAWKLLNEAHDSGSPFQFILSDWNMPGMTGLDLLKKMRQDEKFKKIPFLMITAEGEQANVVIAVQAGVSNFIIKPFSQDTLQEKIKKIFGA